ncbi:MAG: PEP-CTERM sorting domain-containing protein [Bryobacteraceae bacterium]|nr:PEP-CTERM sorting domain-containing protein [Bryobacteraceae bacterium]
MAQVRCPRARQFHLAAFVLVCFLAVVPLNATPVFVAGAFVEIGVNGYFLGGSELPGLPEGLVFGDPRASGFATGFERGDAVALSAAIVDIDVPSLLVAAVALGAADGVGSRALALAEGYGQYKITNNSSNTYDIGFDIDYDYIISATGSEPNDFSLAFLLIQFGFSGGLFDENTLRLTLGPGQSSIVWALVRAGGDAFVTPEPATSALLGAGVLCLGIAFGLKRRRTSSKR